MLIIDLFCGQGGAAMGMHQALAEGGIEHQIIGVDIRPQSRYPFEFVQADAVDFPVPATADFIWASPPCQAYSRTHALHPDKPHPDLVEATRRKLQATGMPFCMENVPGSPLHSSLILRGNMFGLPIKRDRCFELSFFARSRICAPCKAQPWPVTLSHFAAMVKASGGLMINRAGILITLRGMTNMGLLYGVRRPECPGPIRRV